jgi:hypothetical protein
MVGEGDRGPDPALQLALHHLHLSLTRGTTPPTEGLQQHTKGKYQITIKEDLI